MVGLLTNQTCGGKRFVLKFTDFNPTFWGVIGESGSMKEHSLNRRAQWTHGDPSEVDMHFVFAILHVEQAIMINYYNLMDRLGQIRNIE